MTTTAAPANANLIEQIGRMDGARLRAYRENLAFYQGQQWLGAARRRERRLVFNYAKALIDKTASYLMSGLSFVVDPPDSIARGASRRRGATEQALREVYEANNLAQLDFDSEIDAAVLGDGAFKVTWDALRAARAGVGAGRAGHLRLVGGRRRTRACGAWPAATASRTKRRRCSTAPASSRRNGRQLRASARRRRIAGQHSVVEVWTRDELRAVAGRRAARGEGQPVRLHPLRHLPQPARAEEVLGRERHRRRCGSRCAS